MSFELRWVVALFVSLGLAGCCFDPLFRAGAAAGECNPLTMADHCEGSDAVHCTVGRGHPPTLEHTPCENGCFETTEAPICAHSPMAPCTPGEPDRCSAAPDVGAQVEHCRPVTAGGGLWDSIRVCYRGCTGGRCIE